MATYVFSDVHGHAAPLKRAIERTNPSKDDVYYCLGDMIDRGPDPLGVIEHVRSLPNAHVIMGNHEDLMLACMEHPENQMCTLNWGMNGGCVTADALAELSEEEADAIVEWVSGLPTFAHVRVGERDYVLVHAGIDSARIGEGPWDTGEKIGQMLLAQKAEDLLWIRDGFWGCHTGLIDEDGRGPIVIAGHTPTVYLAQFVDDEDVCAADEEGRATMVRMGADESTGGVSDRWDIDAGAAGGAGFGRVLVLRLDDGEEFYEDIAEGE
ncbi:metallophosphoesterase family protein [Paratractidigestivibacter sp.]|uniref:metallophosphoesterase family protein n=1 Tax=Paratractidigestivibacter sp. TaxID=2847316 RepID=UPI002ABE589E|nr:metallophosphoesterase family protein [Paratractidigestivibacter sp.]